MTIDDIKGLENLVKLWRLESETNKRQARLYTKEEIGKQSYTLGEAAGLALAAKQLAEFLK